MNHYFNFLLKNPKKKSCSAIPRSTGEAAACSGKEAAAVVALVFSPVLADWDGGYGSLLVVAEIVNGCVV